MAFEKVELKDSWFNKLDLGKAGVRHRAPEAETWPCAIDIERALFFTPLLSRSHESREGWYFYLLAIGDDLIVIRWDNGLAKILSQGDAARYPQSQLEELINEGAVVACYDKKPFSFKLHT